MKIIKASDPKSTNTVLNVLKNGGVIVYPTDTLYGLGVDATNDDAIDKINSIKGRKGPISVLAPDIGTAVNWMDITTSQRALVQRHLGGPKTIIVPVKKNVVSDLITGKYNSLGIRIPDNEFCIRLSRAFGKPITSTSVNRTGEDAINDPEKIADEFGSDLDILIDGGTLPKSLGSTIYQLKGNTIKILRK